jgi:hypothetical protein
VSVSLSVNRTAEIEQKCPIPASDLPVEIRDDSNRLFWSFSALISRSDIFPLDSSETWGIVPPIKPTTTRHTEASQPMTVTIKTKRFDQYGLPTGTDILTPEDVARAFNITGGGVRKMFADGRLTGFQLCDGGPIRIHRASVEAIIDAPRNN